MRFLQGKTRRRGVILVLFAVCLILIMSLVAMVIDGGLLQAERVRIQVVADAAALAGACELYRNYPARAGVDSDGSAAAGAQTIAADNGCANDGVASIVEVNIPPVSGTYAGRAGYCEVLITSRQDRYFSNVFQGGPLYVRSRSVARGAWVPFNASFLSLDEGSKGVVSAQGSGGSTTSAATAFINGNRSNALSVSGGSFQIAAVNITGSYSGSGATGTVTTGVHPTPDPLAYLPAPGEAGAPSVPFAGSIVTTPVGGGNFQYDLYPGSVSNLPTFVSGDQVIFHQASSNGNGGIYYLAAGGLNSNNATVTMAAGETGGLMIYTAGTGSGNTINISGDPNSSLTLGPRTDGPYTGLVLFQSRTLTDAVTVTGDGAFSLAGTVYAPAARLQITGNGASSVMGSQWIGREFYFAGNGAIGIAYSDATVARTRIIAIME